MAITPSQWSHVLTIPEAFTPSAATSGQTLVVTEGVIAKLSTADQDTFWNAVQNGGGDVRICENPDGTNQLPVEVVSLDNGARTCAIWTRKITYSGTGNLYVFIGKAGETQPPVTDPFGRNAVWVDYAVVYHFSELAAPFIDSTGNGSSIDSVSDVTTNVSAQVGRGVKSGTNPVINAPSPSTQPIDDITISAWVKIEGLAGSGPNALLGIGGGANGAQMYYRNGPDTFSVQTTTSPELRSTFTLADNSNAWAMVHGVSSSTFMGVYANGTLNASRGGTATTGLHDGTIGILSANSGEVIANSPFQNTVLDEARIARTVFSADYIATEYANQSDPATFYGTPAIAATGGGG